MAPARACALPNEENPTQLFPWKSGARWQLLILTFGSLAERSSPVVFNAPPSRSFMPEGIAAGLLCRSQVTPSLGVRYFLTSDATWRWIRRARELDRGSFRNCGAGWATAPTSAHDLGEGDKFSEACEGGNAEAATTSGDASSSTDGDGVVDPAAKRVTSALELMETLLNSDVDVVESLRNLSRPLSLNGDEDRLVSEIARPVLAYAKRYKAPRVAREERQAAKRAAEAADPMGYLSASATARSAPDSSRAVADLSPREFREPPPLPRGWDPTDLNGIRLNRPVGYSRRSRDARARWQDPEYRERMLKKRKKKYAPRKKKDADAADGEQQGQSSGANGGGAMPATVEEIDQFLNVIAVTAKEAARTYETLSKGERIRREKISMRWKNPSKWLADRLAGAAEKQARLSDPEYLRQRMETRSLKAKRAYETRRRNGNSGKGRPRSKVDQVRAAVLAARAAEARAAAIQAGYATEDDFKLPPEGRRPSVRIKKKDLPRAKRRRGRPRKLLTYEEKVDIAFREALPPRPRGRPRKVRPRIRDMYPPALSHVPVSLKSAMMRSMAEAAARTAAELSGLPPLGLGSRVEALAVVKTQEVTGAREGEWSPQMTAIAAVGIEAWENAWEKAGGAAMRACESREGSQMKRGGDGRPEGGRWCRLGHVLDAGFLLDAATVAEVDTWDFKRSE